MKPKVVMTVFGTRPEAIKMAPVVAALERVPQLRPVTVVTAQHREMLDQVLELFQLRPDYDLDIMQHGQTLNDITVRVLRGLEPVLREARPDLALVHGDTTTAMAAALASFHAQVPVGHVEAGLRSGDPQNPFPEEMNRTLADRLCVLHFAPTARARRTLLAENTPPGGIYVTGNTVIDALLQVVSSDYQFADPALRGLEFDAKRVILVTTHRRENLGEPMSRIYRALKRLLQAHDDVEIVFPVHKNPLVRDVAARELGSEPRVHLIEPLPYRDMANLMARCYLVLTDSGGLQEEAPALDKPVLVLRTTTERPEGLAAGTLQLVGIDEDSIFTAADRLLRDGEAYMRMARAANPYGDGRAAERIAGVIAYYFGFAQAPPAEFGQNADAQGA